LFLIRIYNNFHYKESEEKNVSEPLLTFIPSKNFGLLYRQEPEQGPPEPHQNYCPKPEPEPHKNDAAPQHWKM
jgi:hypothetical protein